MKSQRYERIIDASKDFITLIGRGYRYEFVNESYANELGVSAKDILGKTVAEVWGEDKFERRIKKRLDACLAGDESHDIDEFRFGKSVKYIHVAYYPFRENGEITHAVVFSHDVSAVKRLESKLLDFEFKDPVTGLFNRKSFNIVLDMEMEKARRADADCERAVLFISLRNLSHINATYGYEIGDLLLESTALRIKEALRVSDYVFRFDGNEMAAILSTIKRGIDVPSVAATIRGKVDFPYRRKGTVINIACNIGAAVFPEDGSSRDELVQNAMSALNEARDANEPLVMFNKELYERGRYVARLRSEIRSAFIEKQFEAWFQPIVDREGAIVGAEALIRWNHPELGFVPPSEFIPIAEESQSIEMIGRWILFQVCRYARKWKDKLGGRYLSINLSSREFGSPNLVDDVRAILAAEEVSPTSIKLEITESQSMEDIEAVIARIKELSAVGIDVMIDDFGSGYSSLAYLKRLPAGTIKVDKSFVDDMADDPEDSAFIEGVVKMVASRRKKVLVEGVATKEQRDLLTAMGVDMMQGFWFSLPLTADEFARLLKEGSILPERPREKGSRRRP